MCIAIKRRHADIGIFQITRGIVFTCAMKGLRGNREAEERGEKGEYAEQYRADRCKGSR